MFIAKNNNYLKSLDLSASGISGSIFKTLCLPTLKTLYLDFCPKLDSSKFGLENFHKLKLLSLYGSDIEMDTKDSKTKVIKTQETESENQMRDFAMKRGIRLNNWSIIKKHLVKTQAPLMLSQTYLTSTL